MTIHVGYGNVNIIITFDSQDELNKIKAVFNKHGVESSEYENEEPERGEIRIYREKFKEGDREGLVSDIQKLSQEQLKTHEQTNRQTNNTGPSSGDAAQGAEGPPTPK